jgi:hypothetical protein
MPRKLFAAVAPAALGGALALGAVHAAEEGSVRLAADARPDPLDSGRPAAASASTPTDAYVAAAVHESAGAAFMAGEFQRLQVEEYLRAVAEAEAEAEAAATRSRRSGGGSSCGSSLECIRQCESHGDYGSVSGNGQYRGAYQFDQSTWESVGGTGDPAAASPEEQDARAATLYGRSGTSPWPTCG